MVDYGYDAPADYGYAEQTDYGYGDSKPAQTDYGYGEQADYGYGEQTDCGYGDQAEKKPAQTDYGYGEQTDYGYGAQTDYGYGDAKPDDGFGYEMPAEPVAPPPRRGQVKRRCSVTKYSLDESAQETHKAQQDMVSMVQMIRNGGVPSPPPATVECNKPGASDLSAVTVNTSGTLSCESSVDGIEAKVLKAEEKKVKKGMMTRMRKRLSVFA